MGQFSFVGEKDKEVLDDSEALIECVREWKGANRDDRKRVRIQYESAESTSEDSPPLRWTKGRISSIFSFMYTRKETIEDVEGLTLPYNLHRIINLIMC